jgi:sulfhydrogenase subunit gamma (sulfur reductase)
LKNEYLPSPAIIESIQKESFDTKTFKLVFEDKALAESFDYKPGQFVQVSLLGVGEAPISITSCPADKGFLELTIRAAGKLTRAIHQLKEGDRIYIRGPYGNSFPLDEVAGKDLYFVAGGIGLPPLRGVIRSAFDRRGDFGKIKILYGAKTPNELCFKEELKAWQQIDNTQVLLTVDEADEKWQGNVGVVTKLWDKTDMVSSNGVAYVCGPPIMIKFVVEKLLTSGFKDEYINITLERYMKCGIGKCGHCNIADKFVCVDGPVFTYGQLKGFPDKERAMA